MRIFINYAIIVCALTCLANCSSQPESTGLQEIVIGIKADKTILVDNKIVEVKNLVGELKNLGISSETRVNLKIESDVEMGLVNAVQRALRYTKASKISYAGMNN